VFGRVGALIELGTGFNPILTGRENIYINGSVLGLTKREIEDQIDSIIAFSEIGEHIDSPVQNYSSGMKVRLGFAVAAQLSPDILLIDEVLSVGDIGFRAKCINKIDRIQRNAAVVFVSHHMSQVARICTHIVVLDQGKVIFQGSDVARGIERYYDRFNSGNTSIFGSGRAKIHKIDVYPQNRRRTGNDAVKINCRDDLFIELTFSLEPEIRHPIINVAFFSKDMRNVAQCYSSNCNFTLTNTGQEMTVRLHLPQIPFNPGIYNISVTMVDDRRGEVLTRHEAARAMQVVGSFIGHSAIQLHGHWACL
jgi:lipopolysaccharide transport system ATP-binding protein